MTADVSSIERSGSTRRRIGQAAFIGLVIVLAIGAYVLWGVPPRLARGPLHAQRSSSGEVVISGEEKGNTIGGKATALAARTSFGSARSSSSSDDSVFAASTAAVFNLSDHLLMQRVGEALFRKLTESRLERVDYYPAGHRPADGHRLPDLLFTLDLISLKEGGVPLRNTIEVQLAITAGEVLSGRDRIKTRTARHPPGLFPCCPRHRLYARSV